MSPKKKFIDGKLDELKIFNNGVLEISVVVPGHELFPCSGLIMVDSVEELRKRETMFLFTENCQYYFQLCLKNGNTFVTAPLACLNMGPKILSDPKKHADTLYHSDPVKIDFTDLFKILEKRGL